MVRRRTFVLQALSVGGVISINGCGSVLYPERVRTHHSRDIDWRVVALDGLGLILFFVPGVIAFVVDFYTGAIYLPPQRAASYRPPASDPLQATAQPPDGTLSEGHFEKVSVPAETLNQATIETTVARHTGKKVSLEDESARVSPLPDLDHYPDQLARHRQDTAFGMATRNFFQSLAKIWS